MCVECCCKTDGVVWGGGGRKGLTGTGSRAVEGSDFGPGVGFGVVAFNAGETSFAVETSDCVQEPEKRR